VKRTGIAMAEPADVNVDELRRRARRRLVGAVVLALGVAVVVPMLLETEQKPLGDDVSVKIPPVDSGKFVNRLNDGTTNADGNAKAADDASKPAASVAAEAAPERQQKYDTRLPDGAPASSATPPSAAATVAPEPATSASTASNPPVIITDKSPAPPTQKPAAAENPRTAAAAPHRAPEPSRSAHGEGGASPHDGYAVQLAAFADDRGANSLAGRLKKSGYAAYTEPLKTSKGTLWRVRVGPYPSRDAAIAARDKLKTEGQSGIVAAIK
jgi:DedD protein